MSVDKWQIMRDELMKLTGKQLKAIAKKEHICLGGDAGRKESTVAVIVRDVARATGCSVSSIKLYASGEVMPRIDKAVRIAQYLGFRLEAIATN